MMRRCEDCAPAHIRRDGKRTHHVSMLETNELILARHLGQRRQQMARILWYPATPVGIQTGIYGNAHAILMTPTRGRTAYLHNDDIATSIRIGMRYSPGITLQYCPTNINDHGE